MKRVLLAGAGHAHAAFLASLQKAPLPGLSLALVSPRPRQIYSAMLPGLLAGHYRREKTEFDVAALARRAGAEFIAAEVTGVDPEKKELILEAGRRLAFDVASLNVGSRLAEAAPGHELALPVKPFEDFVDRLPASGHVAICGGGAAGVEIAMALRYRGREVTLFSHQSTFNQELEARVARALRRRGVDYRPGRRVDRVEPGPVVVTGPTRQQFDLVLWAPGAAALPWLASSGLALDDGGFVRVDDRLRSVSHPHVFALGDCAATGEAKSGVHAVRQGMFLHSCFQDVLSGRDPGTYRANPKALMLLSCGNRYAIAARGGWSAEGRWAWWWKNSIDRRWLRKLSGN